MVTIPLVAWVLTYFNDQGGENMKKFLSLLALLMFCVLIAACGKTKTPEKLTETTRYEYNSEGFYVIKDCYDKKGRLLEEYYYTIDGEIYSLDCTIKAYNTYDKNGNLLKSEEHYVSNPCHAVRETVLVIEAIEHETFDFKVVNEDGNIELYMKQTKNEKGQVTREEYFTRGGRFVRAEEVDYREDGTVSARRGKNARGELTYESECNEKGNFITTKLYDETGRNSEIISAAYYESGMLGAYNTAAVDRDGYIFEAVPTTEFDEFGRLKKYYSLDYHYNEDGSFTIGHALADTYYFNSEGYLEAYLNSLLLSKDKTYYRYDEQGRLYAVVTRDISPAVEDIFESSGLWTLVTYEYRADNSVVVHTEQVKGGNKQVVYTDTKGRMIKSESYRKDGILDYETLEYDKYGNVTRRCEYKNEQLIMEYLYEYNEHGDLVKEQLITHSSQGSSAQITEFEYSENGYIKNILSYVNQKTTANMSYTEEYDEDGGHVYTEYFLGQISKKVTYNKYDEIVKWEDFPISYG